MGHCQLQELESVAAVWICQCFQPLSHCKINAMNEATTCSTCSHLSWNFLWSFLIFRLLQELQTFSSLYRDCRQKKTDCSWSQAITHIIGFKIGRVPASKVLFLSSSKCFFPPEKNLSSFLPASSSHSVIFSIYTQIQFKLGLKTPIS